MRTSYELFHGLTKCKIDILIEVATLMGGSPEDRKKAIKLNEEHLKFSLGSIIQLKKKIKRDEAKEIIDIYISLTPQERNDAIRIFSSNEEKSKLLYQSITIR